MRTISLLALVALAWVGLVLHVRAPTISGMAAAPSTSPAAAAAPAVHATTEADLALLREARPTWDGQPYGDPRKGGLAMRWCVAQNGCR